jgi:hypothetical protein
MKTRYKVHLARALMLFSAWQLLALSALAYPPTFGTEFNFTNQALEKAWRERGRKAGYKGSRWQNPAEAEQSAAEKIAAAVKESCGEECVVKTKNGKFGATEYEIEFKNGWGFNISVDPAVVEIQTIPETSSKIRENVPLYQKYIFDAVKTAGFAPSQAPDNDQEMSAHLNVGFRSAFENDPKAFLRFFIDYANHPSMASGILGVDQHNAPPIATLDLEQRKALSRIVEYVNEGAVKTADVVIRLINYKVYTSSPNHKDEEDSSGRHFQAFGLKQLLKDEFRHHDMPFELRAVRQQLQASDYALVSELMEKRLDYLKKQEGPIRYEPKEISPDESLSSMLAANFYVYASEMGEDWEKYRTLLRHDVQIELERGTIQRVFQGQEYPPKYIMKIVEDNRANSPWLEERYLELLNAANEIKPKNSFATCFMQSFRALANTFRGVRP